MVDFPLANVISNAAVIETDQKNNFEKWLAATKQFPGGAPISTLGIVSGVITPTTGLHSVDVESGSTDDLTTIAQTNLPDGSFLWLRAINGHSVVCKHNVGGTGKLSLVNSADFTLGTSTDKWLLLRRDGTIWVETGRFYGPDTASHRAFYATPGFGQNTFTGRQEWSRGTSIPSAATLALGTDGNYFQVTGTTGISAISSAPAGTPIKLMFQGILTITHNATSLILALGTNYTTRVGDVIEFVSEGSGNWRQAASASGGAQVLVSAPLGVSISNTAGETLLYGFNIPGGTLGTQRRVRVEIPFSLADNTAGLVVGFFRFKLYYGGSLACTLAIKTKDNDGAVSAQIGADGNGGVLTAMISAQSSVSSQAGHLAVQFPMKLTSGLLIGNPMIESFAARGGTAINSAATQTLQLNGLWDGAGGSKVFIGDHVTVVVE